MDSAQIAGEPTDSIHLYSPPCFPLLSTLLYAKTYRDCSFDALFLLPLILLFLHPIWSLSSHRPTFHLIHRVSLSNPPRQKKNTCTYSAWILKPAWPDQYMTLTQYNHIIYKYDRRGEWGETDHQNAQSIPSFWWSESVRVCAVCLCLLFFSSWFGFHHNLIPPPICSQRSVEEWRREERWEHALFIPVPPLPLCLLSFFVLHLSAWHSLSPPSTPLLPLL